MLKRMAVAALFAVCVSGLSMAIDVKDVPSSLDRAKVGQWVKYKIAMGEQKQSITKVTGTGDDMELTVKYETKMMGQDFPASEQTFKIADIKENLANGLKSAEDVKVSKAKVTAGGKEYDVTKIESFENGKATRVYMSAAIPVTALVMMEADEMGEDPVMELVEFGE